MLYPFTIDVIFYLAKLLVFYNVQRGRLTNSYTGTLVDDYSGWRHLFLIHLPTQVDLTIVKRWNTWRTLALSNMCLENYFLASLFGSNSHEATP